MNLLKPYLLIILIVSTFLVGACGQTGDLFLPEENSESEEAESNKEKSKT